MDADAEAGDLALVRWMSYAFDSRRPRIAVGRADELEDHLARAGSRRRTRVFLMRRKLAAWVHRDVDFFDGARR